MRRIVTAWRRPACLVLAALVAGAVFAAAASMRADLAARTRALQAMMAATPAPQRTVVGTTDYERFRIDNVMNTDAITQAGAEIYSTLAKTTPLVPASHTWSAVAVPDAALVDAPASAVTSAAPPRLGLEYRENIETSASLVAGRWPNHATVNLDTGAVTMEIAMTVQNAARFGVTPGSTLKLSVLKVPDPIVLTVVGILKPTGPDGPFWQSSPTLGAPVHQVPLQGGSFWTGEAVIGYDELGALDEMFSPGDLTLTWTYPIAVGAVAADGAAVLAVRLRTLNAVADDVASTPLGANQSGVPVDLRSGLLPPLVHFLDEQDAARRQTAMPVASLAAIGLVALALASRSAGDRRGREFALLRARGAPLREIAATATLDPVLTVLPSGLAAMAIAARLPGRTPAGLWWSLGIVLALAVAAPGALAVGRCVRDARRSRGKGMERSVVGRRRTAQAAMAVLCIGGLEEARSHGFVPGGGVDLYTACAPVLAAVLAALVTLNAAPRVLRLLVRAADRRRGPVGLLSIGRIARAPASAAGTVFVMTLVLCTADLVLALHRGSGRSTGSAARGGGSLDPVQSATAASLVLLAWIAVTAGCLVVALDAAGDAARHRAVTGRLSVMGLTARQTRAVALTDLAAMTGLAAIGGTAAAVVLMWTVRPALAGLPGAGDARLTGAVLGAPVLAVVPLAVAVGMAGAALARRRAVGVLRLGDDESDGD